MSRNIGFYLPVERSPTNSAQNMLRPKNNSPPPNLNRNRNSPPNQNNISSPSPNNRNRNSPPNGNGGPPNGNGPFANGNSLPKRRAPAKKMRLSALGSILYKMPKAKLIRAIISYHTKRWRRPRKNM